MPLGNIVQIINFVRNTPRYENNKNKRPTPKPQKKQRISKNHKLFTKYLTLNINIELFNLYGYNKV